MTADSLLGALLPVLDAFEALGVRYYVGGSFASSAYGIPRASIDVDLVADLRAGHVDPLLRRLGDSYLAEEGRIRDAISRRRSFNLIHVESMFKVDVFVLKERAHDRLALDRAVEHSLESAAPGRRIRMATAEDTVLAKLEWFRSGGETSERQWADIRGVLVGIGPELDRPYLRQGALELGVTDLLDRALAEAEESGS